MSYYDGYLVPIKEADKEVYLQHSAEIEKVFKDGGALSIVEFWGDNIPDGEVTSFPLALKLEEGEAVLMGYIEWESREAREKGWEKIEGDERMSSIPMPFDGKRMIYGGFEKVIDQ